MTSGFSVGYSGGDDIASLAEYRGGLRPQAVAGTYRQMRVKPAAARPEDRGERPTETDGYRIDGTLDGCSAEASKALCKKALYKEDESVLMI